MHKAIHFPVIMIVTTGAGGSSSAQLASFLPVSYTQSDSEPTSTMDVVPPGLSIEEASNSLWTTNTWITTNAPGESEPTVVPVLVGCPGCGPPGHGLIVFGLPKIPRVQFHFPSIPKMPRFHVRCLRVLGITIGSCSDESKLPEIITDPPEQGDVEQSDPQDEKKDPDTDDKETNPDDKTKSDDKQTSTTSEMSEVSTSIPSSSESSPTSSSSSTSTSSCTSGITLSATSICNMPSLKGVVHRNVEATYIVPSLTGTRELPEYTPYPESAATFSSSVPTANTDISASSGTWAAASSTSSAKNNMATTTSSLTTSSPPQTTESPSPTSSSSSQIKDSSSQPEDDPSPPLPEDTPSTPLIDPTAPPEGPWCHHRPQGKYMDSNEVPVKLAAERFCDVYKDRIFHQDDQEIVEEYGPHNDDPEPYYISVKWDRPECDKPEGSSIRNRMVVRRISVSNC